MKSDHWFHDLFRVMPDLVRHLLPELPAGLQANTTASAYRFQPVVLKQQAHSPDGVLWPQQHPGGSQAWPVVLLEVQMQADPRFQRRLGAETFRLLQQHEQIEHLKVVVLLPHRRLALGGGGPRLLRRFLRHDVSWVDLSALARQADLDPALALLTLPVRPENDLGPCCQNLLQQRPEWIELILPILCERLTGLSRAQIMTLLGISKDVWRHSRAFQETLEEGRREEASGLALRQLQRRCGILAPATTAHIEALALSQLEELAMALLDFESPQDLTDWLQRLEG